MKILFKDFIVVNEEGHNILSVVVDGDTITFVGKEAPADDYDEVLDGHNKMLTPGFVNTHTHTPMTLLRSYADGYPLSVWLFEKIFPIEDKMTAEDIKRGAYLAALEMIASGTTLFNDMYSFMDEVANVVIDSGLKANLSRGLMFLGDESGISNDFRLAENITLYENYHNAADGRIRVDFAPHAVYTCPPKYIEKICETAAKYDTGMHIHLSETVKENADLWEKYKKTPTEYMRDLGVFNFRTTAAHCVHLTEGDMDILREYNVYVAHNPTSNLKLGSGIANISKMKEKKINVTIGTDGASSNNNLNILEEIHIASILTNGATQNPEALSSKDVFLMATKRGAEALGFSDTGSIEAGMKADLVVFDIDKPHFYPRHSMLSNLLYSAQASDIERVYVNGKLLYKGGEYLTLDYEKIIYNANKSAKALFL
ncbi:MAG: amidohydrolase [Clostridiaceae bacterium]|nr:amidohydrolase [Clostridiaceae bacterium]